MIGKLTWRNLWRNRRRTFITVTSVTFAVLLAILMRSFQKGVFDNLVKNVVSFYYGYIQIHRQGYWDEQVLDNSLLWDDSVENKLQQVAHVRELVPRLESFVLASIGNNTKGCMLVGTDPGKEDALTGLKENIIQGQYFSKDESAALVAEGFAKRLDIQVNDTIVLLGQGYHGAMAAGKYPVKGILHFGSPTLNDGLVYLPLSITQSFLSADNVITSISVAIDKPDDMHSIQKAIARALGNDYEVMNWKELMPDMDNYIKSDGISLVIFTGILYLIISFGIFGTILMMTAERQYEFGMLIAIGMKKSRLGLVLLNESILITLIGLMVGIAISFPLMIYFNRNPLRLTGEVAKVYEQFGFEALFPTAVDPSIFITQSSVVLLIAFFVGLYPIWHISRIDPVAAMKR